MMNLDKDVLWRLRPTLVSINGYRAEAGQVGCRLRNDGTLCDSGQRRAAACAASIRTHKCRDKGGREEVPAT
ncbi:hypothetical protein HpMS107_00410 [Helicobacter pylori]